MLKRQPDLHLPCPNPKTRAFAVSSDALAALRNQGYQHDAPNYQASGDIPVHL